MSILKTFAVRGMFIVSITLDILETDGECSIVQAHCCPSYQLVSSAQHQQLASNVIICVCVCERERGGERERERPLTCMHV
jgi:hypothetical protein